MKAILHIILLEILLFLVCYLLGSFYATSFDIKDWIPATRGLVIFGFSTVGVLVFPLYGLYTER